MDLHASLIENIWLSIKKIMWNVKMMLIIFFKHRHIRSWKESIWQHMTPRSNRNGADFRELNFPLSSLEGDGWYSRICWVCQACPKLCSQNAGSVRCGQCPRGGGKRGQISLENVAFYILSWRFICCISILKAQGIPKVGNQVEFLLTQCFPILFIFYHRTPFPRTFGTLPHVIFCGV